MQPILAVFDRKNSKNLRERQKIRKEISEANPWTVPSDWFKTDTITIKGRIEEYDAELFGFSSMACYYNDVFEKGSNFLLVWQTIHVAFDITLLAIAGTAIAIIIWT